MGDLKKNKQKKAREKLPELPSVGNQRKWNIIKVVLRSICLLLSIVDVAEVIALDLSSHGLDYWASVAYPVLGTFLFWDVIEFVVIIVRRSIAKGVHPGAHVGVELILCLGGIFTVGIQAYTADWYQLTTSWVLRDTGWTTWAYVALTQFSFLSLLTFLRFILFVRACVEIDRRKRDRRVQQLVFAIQEQGRDPQNVPLAAFTRARELDHVSASQILKALSPSTMTQPTLVTSHSSASSSTVVASQPPRSPEERDFAYKYNFPIATVPELLENGIHPEDARNQKVLIGAFPR
ncbi:hypothetical protein RRF57_006675 [Xylaria bambusicola]|uniref:Uncharacterized protein n=1 Tax=Xylaria bambusicola TaxID=326684 RepID=A0AAN7UER7_9PEZI